MKDRKRRNEDTEISNLQDPGPAEQQIRNFHVAVHNLVLVDVRRAREQLLGEALDLRYGKLHTAIQQTAQIVLHVIKHHVNTAFEPVKVTGGGMHNLADAEHIRVVQRLHNPNFANGRDGKLHP